MPKFKLVQDMAEVNLSSDWVDSAKFNSKDRIVDYKGHECRIISKKERTFSTPERVGRGFLGVVAVVFSLGFSLFSKDVRHLFVGEKSKVRFAIAVQLERASDLEIGSNKITTGQGEYIVFHRLPNGENKPLTPQTFEKVYNVLIQHSPASLMNSGSEKAREECANRYGLIKEKLKEIDSTLEAVFVPRSLYELVFIRKCIKEDLKSGSICPDLEPFQREAIPLKNFAGNEAEYQEYLGAREKARQGRKCWHLCHFDHAGENDHAGVKEVAYRLNNTMLKAFTPSDQGFTHQELSIFAEKEIGFLKEHHRKGQETMEKNRKGEQVKEIASCDAPGPTTNFGYESTYGKIRPMGIRHDADAQIIRNAIALECSKIAHHAFFVYRGANFKKDAPLCNDKPYSLSYGTGLFAGCVYDGDATPFYFMRENDAYAIPVPFDQIENSPFYIPTTHPVAQLCGRGESFHARTKAWKGIDVAEIQGMDGPVNGRKREHLKSDLSKEELVQQFRRYKSQALQLK